MVTRRREREERARRGVPARYLAAALAARTADEGVRVSLVLLALDQGRGSGLGGAMITALLVPHVVAAPAVGALIDRARRPRRLLVSMILIFAASLFLTAQILGRLPLWLVFLVLLAGGCCGPAITGGLSSQIPALVQAGQVPRAFGVDSLFYNVASMAGPALAGVVAVAAGPVTAQSLLAVCAGAGALGVAVLPITARAEPVGQQVTTRPGLLDGVQEILNQRTLCIITMTSALGQIGPGALPVVAALLAASLGTPAAGGLLLAAAAAGSLVGSLLWTWRPLAPRRSALVAAVSMIGVGTPLAAASATRSTAVTAVLFALSGFFVGPFASALFTARARYADDAVRTQVFTISAGLKVTAAALGAALIGLATDLSPRAQLLLLATSPLLAGILATVLLTIGTTTVRTPVQPLALRQRETSASQR